jgi:hypothetical protein
LISEILAASVSARRQDQVVKRQGPPEAPPLAEGFTRAVVDVLAPFYRDGRHIPDLLEPRPHVSVDPAVRGGEPVICTYDHLSRRVPFRDGPWFGAVPTLTAAAGVTERIRIGTMVTSVKPRSRITV